MCVVFMYASLLRGVVTNTRAIVRALKLSICTCTCMGVGKNESHPTLLLNGMPMQFKSDMAHANQGVVEANPCQSLKCLFLFLNCVATIFSTASSKCFSQTKPIKQTVKVILFNE